ncbi:MAG: hypothetical protein WBY94_17885 [Polyangiaceae bacterium]
MSADHAARKTTVRKTGEEPADDWAGADFAQLGPRIHALVHDLMRGVLAAFVAASPAEIGELIQRGTQNREAAAATWRLDRAARAVRGGSPAAPSPLEGIAPAARDEELGSDDGLKRSAGKRGRIPEAASGRARRTTARTEDASPEARPPLGSHDPFDITSPSELLASSDNPAPSVEAQSRSSASGDRAGAEGGETAPANESGKPKEPSPSSLLEPPAPRGAAATSVVAIDPDTSSERRPRVVLREGERLLSATGSGVVIRRARR